MATSTASIRERHPANTKDGLQTVTAFGLLSDVANGYPVLFSEMTILTALRTAATSALAARVLAPEGSKVMAMIGNGAQSEFQSIAMQAIVGIEEVRLYDIDPAATAKCAANLAGSGLRVVSCTSAEEAMLGAQIVTTCTADKQFATILTDNMVGTGVHLNAIGGDCPGKTELATEILHRADIFVEYPEQTRIEGEIQQLDPDHPVTEFWEVLAGTAKGRTDSRQITLFDSVGFAIEDFSALCYVREAIGGTPFFTPLDMVADPDDPRPICSGWSRAPHPSLQSHGSRHSSRPIPTWPRAVLRRARVPPVRPMPAVWPCETATRCRWPVPRCAWHGHGGCRGRGRAPARGHRLPQAHPRAPMHLPEPCKHPAP